MIAAILIYAVAMTAANLSIAHFGFSAQLVAFNAFVFIGLDLTLRDWLGVRLRFAQMAALIAGTSLLTYVLSPSAGTIALASAGAFGLAALADWMTFTRLSGSWARRANGSNIVGAAVDSVAFPLLAGRGLPLEIVTGMFVAKVAGGALWAWVLSHRFGRTVAR